MGKNLKKSYITGGIYTMKKTTLLSLFTAGAIVATTAGTYAAWDATSVESGARLELTKGRTLAMENVTFDSSLGTIGDSKLESKAQVKVTTNDTKGLTLSVINSDGSEVSNSDVIFTWKKGDQPLVDGKDAAPIAGENVYTLTASIDPTTATAINQDTSLDLKVKASY